MPKGVMFSTLIEMPLPGFLDLILVLLDDPLNLAQLRPVESMIKRQRDKRFDPKFRFAVGARDMDMNTLLLI